MSFSDLLTGTNILIALVIAAVIYYIYKSSNADPNPVQSVLITKNLPPGHILDSKDDKNNSPVYNMLPGASYVTTGGRLVRVETPVVVRSMNSTTV